MGGKWGVIGLAQFPGDHKCNAAGPQKFSYAALDRSETPNAMVTGEYCWYLHSTGGDDTGPGHLQAVVIYSTYGPHPARR